MVAVRRPQEVCRGSENLPHQEGIHKREKKMRKAIGFVLVAGLAATLVAAPAYAKKPKHVHEVFTAQAFPFPNPSATTGTAERSCFAGVEGVHKVTVDLGAPGKGTLKAYMEGFTGDWDLAVIVDGDYYYSLNDQVQGATADEEMTFPVAKGQSVQVSACNWAGAPEAEVHYEGTFK